MQASDAGWLLTAVARGGVVEVSGDQAELLDARHAGGFV